jgi:hypothetical protein
MGRPIGSVNRTKPFTDMLRVALLSGGGRRLRIIADKLAEKAEQGDLQAIQQIADRLDGKPVQALERGDVPVDAMTDQQLMAIIRGGSCNEPALICGPTPAATPWPTKGTTRDLCKPTWAIRISSTRSGTPKWRRGGLKTSGVDRAPSFIRTPQLCVSA